MAGGFTRFLPAEDRNLWTRSQFQDMLAATLGGLVAEETVFGEMTTGPQDDLERATKIARQMVTQWGMSDRLGPRTFGRKEEMVFLGREISEQRNYSEKVAEEIDEEVRRIVDEAHQAATAILHEHRTRLDRLAKCLIEEETLEGEALEALLGSPAEQAPAPTPETASETESEAERASTETDARPGRVVPPPKPGLAWGGQSHSHLSPDVEDQ